MVNPFEPLASLVAVAVSRYGRLYVTEPGRAAGTTRAAAAPAARQLDRHDIEPQLVFADEQWQPSFAPFENRPLYKVVWRDPTGVLWIGRNCHAPSMPPPPVTGKAAVCACPDAVTGEADGRYGPLTSSVAFEPTQYADAAFYQPFVPDVLAGAGPCSARVEPGFLTQWNPAWVAPGDDDRLVWTAEFMTYVDIMEETDAVAFSLVGIAQPSYDPIRVSGLTMNDMKSYWASYVAYVLQRRARVLQLLVTRRDWTRVKQAHPAAWATLCSDGYFRAGVIGAWFTDSNSYARRFKIVELLHLGVPVFYRWSPSLEAAAPSLAMPEEARFYLRDLEGYPSNVAPAFAPGGGGHAEPSAPPSGAAPSSTPDSDDALESAADRSVDSLTDPFDDGTWDRFMDELDATDKANACPSNAAPADGLADADGDDHGGVASPSGLASVSGSADVADGEEALVIEELEPTASVAMDDATVPFPTEGYHFFFAHSSDLASRFEGVVRAVPCKRVDVQVQRIVQNGAEFMTDLAPPRSRVYAGNDNTERLDLVDGEAVPIVPILLIYDDGLTRRVLNYAFEHGIVTNMYQLVEFLIENGMRFSTGVGVTAPQATRSLPLHGVGREYWYNEHEPLKIQYQRWEQAVEALARRPHFARAAIARGGILALALRYFVEPQFALRPSLPVLRYGGARPENIDGRVLHDDWLSQPEEDLLLGRPWPGAPRSFLPPVLMFNRYYAGVLSSNVELWFELRMRELKLGYRTTTGVPAKTALTPGEWKHVLRDASRNWYA